MEFHKKLQQLRKRENLTQEQLAQQLYVSRTAVSKWESGRGYPNLESLKEISKIFSISIDDLLSNDELITAAETENQNNIKKLYQLIFGALDLMVIAFLFMPLFGQRQGEIVRGVTLWSCSELSSFMRILYVISLAAIFVFGALEIFLREIVHSKWNKSQQSISTALHAGAILLFAISRQPYITVFLFLLFLVKIMLITQK